MELAQLQDVIRRTYLDRDRARGLDGTFRWLVEEVGELAKALRHDDREAHAHEVADVLAWLLSVANLLEVDAAQAAARFASGCPRCGLSPCECPLIVPAERAGPPGEVTEAAPTPADHVRRNRAYWTTLAAEYAERAPRQWASGEISWGTWGVPEDGLRILGDVDGLDVVELGCGTAYFSAWLARRGARVVGIDVTRAQLATARAMQGRFGLQFPLIEANAEVAPLPDASFDLALSEYGASIWADPSRWVPEAARLLRPGGRLLFLCTTAFRIIAGDELGYVSDRLQRDLFGLSRLEWPDDDSVEFVLPHGDWIRVLRSSGLEVENLVELQPPAPATREDDYVPLWWARRWPAEEVWVARKRG